MELTMRRLILLSGALTILILLALKIYPKISDEITWLVEDDLPMQVAGGKPLAFSEQRSQVVNGSLAGLKSVTGVSERSTNSSKAALKKAVPSLPNVQKKKAPTSAKPLSEKSTILNDHELVEVEVPVAAQNEIDAAAASDLEPKTGSDSRWVAHLSGGQLQIGANRQESATDACIADNRCPSRDSSVRLVGVVLTTEVEKGLPTLEGRVKIGDAAATPLVYVQ